MGRPRKHALKLKRVRDILPLLEKGYTHLEIAEMYGRNPATVTRWKQKLRDGGLLDDDGVEYRGRKGLKL